MTASTNTQKLIADIGEVKGLLQGVAEMMRSQSESLNRRIDDMHAANSRRLDELNATVSQRFDGHQSELRRIGDRADAAHSIASETKTLLDASARKAKVAGGATGGGVGAIVAIGIEAAKALLHL